MTIDIDTKTVGSVICMIDAIKCVFRIEISYNLHLIEDKWV